ncbi:MAG: hypothetical protein KKC19_01810 [Nanoarchaeota archaeon]|nr:hypothetical protein [Nanoarchaeota archaeon]
MEKIKIPINDEDYVEIYSLALKENNKFFKQHKIIINSQIASSRQIFRNKFGNSKDFKKQAREYLKKIGVIN